MKRGREFPFPVKFDHFRQDPPYLFLELFPLIPRMNILINECLFPPSCLFSLEQHENSPLKDISILLLSRVMATDPCFFRPFSSLSGNEF